MNYFILNIHRGVSKIKHEAPRPALERVVYYYQILEKMDDRVVSSKQLGEYFGSKAAQVRKDLSYFGEFGCKGVGYKVSNLKRCLKKIISFTTNVPIVMVGAGCLGRTIINYPGFKKIGLNIHGIFDSDLFRIGNKVGDYKVRSNKELIKTMKENNIKAAILAVEPEEAQVLVDKMVEAGIMGIWNFTPVSLKVPENVLVFHENLTSSIITLLYMLEK